MVDKLNTQRMSELNPQKYLKEKLIFTNIIGEIFYQITGNNNVDDIQAHSNNLSPVKEVKCREKHSELIIAAHSIWLYRYMGLFYNP